MSDFDDEAKLWARLRDDVTHPPDPSFARIFGEPEPQPEPERDPFEAYRGSDVRTFIPKEEHGDVRSDDVFEWTSEDGGYYLWRRKGEE